MESISSSCQLIKPKGAFLIGSGATGSYAYKGWKLGDVSCFGWPNRAFKASDMRRSAWVYWFWGPKRAFMAFDK